MASCATSEKLCQELWNTHENLVKHTTWRIVRRYGGDFDEAYSEALVLFTEAAQSYKPQLGSSGNWICFWIYKGLQEIYRTRARRLRITGPIATIESASIQKGDALAKHPSFLDELWKNLSPESQHVLTVLFDLDETQFKNKSLLKCLLRSTLRKEGHSNDNISNCFTEISAALT